MNKLHYVVGGILGLVLVACSLTAEPAINNVAEKPSGTPIATAMPEETAVSPTPLPVNTPVSTQTAVPSQPTQETESMIRITTSDGRAVQLFTQDNRSARFQSLTSDWSTDWTRHTIAYDELLSGGPPRDGIPAIDAPQFVNAAEAAAWLADNEPVIALEIDGDARAYPLQILTWHEIVNDTVGNVPVIVTFCPLCNSAIVFDRRLNGQTYDFGTSGLLRNSDLVMYDRTTEGLWQQFTGEAIVGELAGERLTFLPSQIVSFADFRAAYPNGHILSRETGFSRRYGQNPYVGYDDVAQNAKPFLFTGVIDGRLSAVERVVTISLDEVAIDIAYPLTVLAAAGVINDSQGGRDLVLFHTSGTSTALGAAAIAEGVDVGATGVFDPVVDGQKLTFKSENGQIVDIETGSHWNIFGQAIDGPLSGKQLLPVGHGDHFWFSWAAFRPDTLIHTGD